VRIALVTNFWYRRGGQERVVFIDRAGLTEHGHVVEGFASAHALNEDATYARFFPPNVDHGALGRDLSLGSRVATAARLFYNDQAVRGFERFVEAFQPDLVHQHGVLRQMSPAVLERAHALGLPTVLTLHDYSFRCASGTLSRAAAPECVEVSCRGHRYDRAVRFRCVHDSLAASALAAVELLVARALRRYERSVDQFLVPSEYVRERMIEAGLAPSRVAIMPNAIETPVGQAPALGRTVLAYGRLVPEKGFDLLVDAAAANPDVPFVIAGDGRERAELERKAAKVPNVRFAGYLGATGLAELMHDAFMVVMPSRVPETFGMVVLEAWAAGRPVVVSRRGALPELIDQGRTGLVVEPDAWQPLSEAIDQLRADPDAATRMGAEGRREVETRYSLGRHIDQLVALYERLSRPLADVGSARP
jgi:glycosyltransferase involved in cell wall biosynthesis